MRYLLFIATFFIMACSSKSKFYKDEYGHLSIQIDSKILNEKYCECIKNYRDNAVDFFGFEESKYNYMVDSTTLLVEKGKLEDAIEIKFSNSYMDTTFLRKQDIICIKSALMHSIGNKTISKFEVKLHFNEGEIVKVINKKL